MPTPISEEVAGAAINNAVDQGYINVFSGWMYAQNCAETVLQWRIFVNPEGTGSIDVYTYVAGQWVLEDFTFTDGISLCNAINDAIGYLQGAVVITEYRLLRVNGGLLNDHPGSTFAYDGFPATWEPGMTTYLTPATDVVGSILESGVVWNLDDDQGCEGQSTWPTPTT